MAFNSLIFGLFFVCVLFVHALPLQWHARKSNLLLASYLFYAAWNPPFLALLWISTLTDWFAGKRIAISSGNRRKLFLALSILVNLGLLGYFKYGGFLEDNFARMMAWLGADYEVSGSNIILPLGISFYTFQSMSYSIDLYRNKIKPADSILDFALYVSFFPQLVAGPILRAGNFMQQLVEARIRRVEDFGWGIALIVIGLFEKIVLADGLLAPVVEKVYTLSPETTGLDAWVGTLAFSGQIFFDFNGYSVIAVGLAMCLGFQVPWNFLSPYAAIGFSDFWRRWHVTLSAWLRDYLYISLGGNRRGRARTYVNLALTMLLGGLWHGASWLFVLWGAAHGALLVLERLVRHLFGGISVLQATPVRVLLGVLTFVLVTLTWVLFRAESLDDAAQLYSAMLMPGSGIHVADLRDVLVVSGVLFALLATHWFMRNKEFGSAMKQLPWPTIAAILAAMLIAIVLSPGEERDFIYFEF